MSGIGPTDLRRADGALLWYPGRINGLLGPSESGKSWVALLAVSQCVRRGGDVVVIDCEDSAGGMAERLLGLGLSAEELKEHVYYISPDEPLTDDAALALRGFLARIKPDLIILDGLNAAMTLMGLDLLNNKDVTTFYHRLMHLLVETGATVGYVDHTPKNDSEMLSKGGIGAQAKRAMTTGAALRVEVVEHFDRAHSGSLKLWVDKDRTGHVRLTAVEGLAATVRAVPGDGGALELTLVAPVDETDDGGRLVDPVMSRVAETLAMLGPSSVRAVQDALPHKQETIRRALRDLVSRGFVERTSGPNRALIHTIVKTYPHGVSVCPATPGHNASGGVSRPLGRDTTDTPKTQNHWDTLIDVELPDPADDPGAE